MRPIEPAPPAASVDVAANLAAVEAEIAAAARAAARAPEEVTLVAVAKTQPASVVARALAAGQRTFGENRVQEAEGKWPELKNAYPGVSLHLIGPLQRNKVRRAVRLFDVMETIDRPELARAVAEAGRQEGATPDVFVQVNTGEERQKAGVFPEETDALVAACRDDFGLQGARPDVHSADGRRAVAAFRAAARDRPPQRPDRIEHGDERRLRRGGALRRDACAHRHRHLRAAPSVARLASAVSAADAQAVAGNPHQGTPSYLSR